MINESYYKMLSRKYFKIFGEHKNNELHTLDNVTKLLKEPQQQLKAIFYLAFI